MMVPSTPVVVVLVIALVLTGTAAAADNGGEIQIGEHQNVDRLVVQQASEQPGALVPVIVHQRRPGAVTDALRSSGGTAIRPLAIKNAVAAQVPAGAIASLARNPAVLRISFDAPVVGQAQPEPIRGGLLRTVYPLAVGAGQLWSASPALQGTGVAVAVLDTGLAPHPDFARSGWNGDQPSGSRVLASVAVSTRQTGGPGDFEGHGTFTAGIVAGRASANTSGAGDADLGNDAYVGVAPDVGIVNVKVSDRDGLARTSDVIAGIEWVLANKDRYGIRVMALSLLSTAAESYTTSLLDAAVELAWLKGIVVVVAAGNGGPDTSLYPPANDPYVITVGATDDRGTAATDDDGRVWFSAYGRTQDGYAKPEFVAPGRRIVSTLARREARLALRYQDRVLGGGQYIRLSGTSAAAPVVAGVAALVLQARPELTPDQVKWLLLATARPVPGPGVGAGYPRADAAVRFVGVPARANLGLTPNKYLQAAYAARAGLTRWSDVSWDTVAWSDVSWDTVAWDVVARAVALGPGHAWASVAGE